MKPKDIIQLFVLAAIWGSSYMFIRIAAPAIGVPLTMGLRIAIAATIMVGVFAYLRRLPQYTLYWKQYIILGLLNLVLPFALISFSVANLNASIGAILNATTPLFTMIISSLWLKERMTFKKTTGLLIALAGLTILVGWIPLALTGKVIFAIVFSLLAAFLYGLGAVYTRVYLKNAEPLKTATGQLSAAAILVLPLLNRSYSSSVFTVDIIMVVLLLAVLCTAVGYALYFKLISNIGSTNASLLTLLVPVFSLLWGILFLDEPLTPAVLIGLALILGSLKLVFSASGSKIKQVTKSKQQPVPTRLGFSVVK
jgi:drug/metabolite transporter (DMT)-like permease